MTSILRFFYRLRHFLEVLRDYLPILWNDFDWDWGFLFRLVEKKLERMEKHFREDKICLSSNKDARNMRICKNLLRRLREEEYIQEEVHKIFSEHRKHEHKNHLKTLSKKDNDELKVLLQREEYLRKQDIELFCAILKKHYRSWWI